MHIPDGFLNLTTTVATNGITLGALIPAVRQVNRSLTPRRIPLMGLSAAFIFTAQLLSFPIPGGTSVHLVGAVLISILLGPYTGLILTTTALLLQALLFQHGGLFSLGANILNMGVVGCLLGYGLYRMLPGKWQFRIALSVLIVTTLSGTLCALELGFSGTAPYKAGLPAMTMAAAVAGAVEAVATVSILSLLNKIRPDLRQLDKV